jgi:multiple sugar transport system permease protein
VRSSNTANWAIIIGMVWKMTGYYFILFLAGIQQIPMDYYEAAEIDGIRRHQRLIHITIPLLTPTIFFVGLIAIVSTLEAVDLVYIMTQGGPARATNVLIYFIYERAFEYQFWGEAFTASTIFLIALLVFVVIYFLLLERKVHYER